MHPYVITVTIVLLGAIGLPAQGLPSENLFLMQARHALMQEEGSEGLQALVDGGEFIAQELTVGERDALIVYAAMPIATPPTAQINAIMTDLEGALERAMTAADEAPFNPFPATTSYTPSFTSRGDLNVVEGRDRFFSPIEMCRLLVVDAHRLVAEGNLSEAAVRLQQGLRLSGMLCDQLRDPNLWVASTQMLSLNLQMTGELVGQEQLSEETLETLNSDLGAMDLWEITVQEIVGEMVESRKRLIRQAEVDLGMRHRLQTAMTNRHLDVQLEEVEIDLFRGSESFNEEIDRLILTLDQPAHEWSPAIRHFDGDATFRQAVVEVAVVLNTARAWCALAQAQIELEEGVIDPTVIDPFSGAPIRVGTRQLHSVGPDGVDDGGLTAYQTGLRLFTGGDLISPR